MRQVGQGQRGNREEVFSLQAQHLPAGDDDGEPVAFHQELLQQRGCSDELLEVVEQQEDLLVSQETLDNLHKRLRSSFLQA